MPKISYSVTSKNRIGGFNKTIEVDSDKSISIRAFLIGSISQGVSEIKNALESEDVFSAIDCLKRLVPITFDAFMDYRVGGMELSSKGKIVIEKMIKGENCDFKNSNLSKREWNELMESFGFKEKIL